MTIAHIALFQNQPHREAVMRVWRACFGYDTAHNEPALVIDKKLAVEDGLFFVALRNAEVVGTVMAGYDGHRGWLYSVAVAPVCRGQGVGRLLVLHAEQALIKLGCMKINLQLLQAKAAVTGFYAGLGYFVEPRVSMGKLVPENFSLG